MGQPKSAQRITVAVELYSQDQDPREVKSNLLFINQSGPEARIQARDQSRVHAHVRHRNYVRQRKEKALYETRKRRQVQLHSAPDVDSVLCVGDIDPFNTLPIKISSSERQALEYFGRHIAPLHYPPGLGPKYKHTNSATRIAAALTDPAFLHSIIGATNGHLLFYAKIPTISLCDVLHHKTVAMRVVNERIALASTLTDETLATIAVLITSQIWQGDYGEMKVHLRGLFGLVNARGGLQALGMRGLLAGEIQWCDNVTALSSLAKPLLSSAEIDKSPYKTFKDTELNAFFCHHSKRIRVHNSPLRNPALKQILSGNLISALWDLLDMTDLLNTSPQFSEYDMLVYDHKRTSIQHNIADVDVLSPTSKTFHITESCRLAAAIYSFLAMYSFRPPLKIYGDLAKWLQTTLMTTKGENVCRWGLWQNLLLWTLFIGGYAALGREERRWFSAMIGVVLRERELVDWWEVRELLQMMPVHHLLWEPFEVLWSKAVLPVTKIDASSRTMVDQAAPEQIKEEAF